MYNSVGDIPITKIRLDIQIAYSFDIIRHALLISKKTPSINNVMNMPILIFVFLFQIFLDN